jgi:peptidoglycan/xylan/chitin deacetylase (PgdA/CDA1 family)
MKNPSEYVKSFYDDQKELVETILSDGVPEVSTDYAVTDKGGKTRVDQSWAERQRTRGEFIPNKASGNFEDNTKWASRYNRTTESVTFGSSTRYPNIINWTYEGTDSLQLELQDIDPPQLDLSNKKPILIFRANNIPGSGFVIYTQAVDSDGDVHDKRIANVIDANHVAGNWFAQTLELQQGRPSGYDPSSIIAYRIGVENITASSSDPLDIDLAYLKFAEKPSQNTQVCFIMDGPRNDVWDVYKDIFREYKHPATLAVVPEFIENSPTAHLSVDQMQTLERDYGWTSTLHGADRPDENSLSEWMDIMAEQKRMMYEWGLVSDINHWGPNAGQYETADGESIEDASKVYFDTTREAIGDERYASASKVMSNPHHFSAGLVQSDTDAIDMIDRGIENNNDLVFYFHDETELTGTQLRSILDHIESKSGSLDVVTFGELVETGT